MLIKRNHMIKAGVIAFAFGSLFSANISADPSPDPYMDILNQLSVNSGTQTAAVTSLQASIDDLLGGYGHNAAKQFLFAPPSDDTKMLQNAAGAQLEITRLPYKQAQSFTVQGVLNTLTNFSDKPTKDFIKNVSLPLVPVPLKDGKPDPNAIAIAQQQSANFDLNSLLAPLHYIVNQQEDQTKTAQNFIQIVSGLANPMLVVDFSNITPAAIAKNSEVAAYLASVRMYAAQQAVGLSNLYQMYAERVPNSGDKLLAQAMPPPPVAANANNMPPENPSVLQVRHYLATRRIQDPDWYTHMATKATPVEIQRQTLFLLAEMRAEMFQQDMELERLNATLSVLVLQNAAGSRTLLNLNYKQIQSDVGSLKSTANTTTPTQTPNIGSNNASPQQQQQLQQQQQNQQGGANNNPSSTPPVPPTPTQPSQ